MRLLHKPLKLPFNGSGFPIPSNVRLQVSTSFYPAPANKGNSSMPGLPTAAASVYLNYIMLSKMRFSFIHITYDVFQMPDITFRIKRIC